MVGFGNQSPLRKIRNLPLFVFFKDIRSVFKLDELGLEILKIALPASLALAADPIASLIDTAFIGRLGPVPLAAVGVAIALFNQASKVVIFPLVSITTSFVAEEETIRKLSAKASEEANLEKVSSDNTKKVIPKDVALENLEKVSSSNEETKELMLREDDATNGKQNAEALKEQKAEKNSANNDVKNLMLEDADLDNLEKGSAPKVETKELVMGEEQGTDGKKYAEALKEQNAEKNLANYDAKNLMLEDVDLDNLEKGSAPKEETKELATGEGLTATVDKSLAAGGSSLDEGKVKHKKRQIASASTALLLGIVLGILETIFLYSLAKPLLSFMGVKSGSPMLIPAQKYLKLRSLGAPAVLLSLAMQGIFRGFKDTMTPLYATVAGDLLNIILDPILIFVFRLGVSGAAIAHVLSQYLIILILLLKLIREVDLTPPSPKALVLQLSRFLKSGSLLLARVIAVTFCVTLSASLAARLGPTPMAAFQVCLQVWMASSLLADGLAVAGQAILACAFAEKDYAKVTASAARVLQMCFVMGLALSFFVGLGMHFGSGIFTNDKKVILIMSIGIPFIAITQPINSLAFVFDGINFGASDFAYSAYSMVLVAGVSIVSLFILSKTHGFVGIWIALTIYMVLRAFAGIWRMASGTGPWRYLRSP